MDGRAPSDPGYATVFAAAAVGVLVLLLGLGLQVGAAVLARHRAETAADLAALAGAREAVAGPMWPARGPPRSLSATAHGSSGAPSRAGP